MNKKKIILILSLTILFVCLLVVTLLGKFVFGWFDEKEDEPYVAPELMEGESYYYLGSSLIKNIVLMYGQMERSEIYTIRVHNTTGDNYYFIHEQDGKNNYFLLGQSKDDTFDIQEDDIYYPQIISEFGSSFDYTSLYDDTSTLPSMIAAVGAVVINERITPDEATGWTQEWLSHYGLADADDPAYFEILSYLIDSNGNYIYLDNTGTNYVVVNPNTGKYHYLNSNGTLGAEFEGERSNLTIAVDTENVRRVYVGRPTVDDKGYYLYLEGRQIVYTTTSTYLNQVVERDVGYYVAPRLVTASESSTSFQFTKDFSVWNGTILESIGTAITEKMSVAFTSDMIWTFDTDNMLGNESTRKYLSDYFLSLSDSSTDGAFLEALVGTLVGDKIDIIVSSENLTEVGKTETYQILSIEGYFVGNSYSQDDTHVVTGQDRVIIKYTDGSLDSEGNTRVLYGYVDLTDATLPSEFKTALVGLSVQQNLTGVSISYQYIETNSNLYNLVIAVESIDAIYSSDGGTISSVTYDSYVKVTYYITQNGEEVGSVQRTFYIPSSTAFSDDDKWKEFGYSDYEIYTLRPFYSSLIGKTVKSYTNTSGASTLKTTIQFAKEWISDFTFYKGSRIQYVVDYEQVIEFYFTNDVDPYYGANSYVILAPEDRVLYGVDEDAAYNTLYTFTDLIGNETVALGLTDENMKKYGLYANRVFYSMPLDVYGITDDKDYTNYYSKNSIGFNLYISNKQSDGSRYVGSDMYDIVVRIADGSTFDYVDWNFETKWVQNSLLMVNYSTLRGMTFDLNFDEADYNHVWGFDLSVDRNYEYKTSYTSGGELVEETTVASKLYAALVDGGAHQNGATYSSLRSIYNYASEVNTDDYSKLESSLQVKPSPGVHVQTVNDTLRYITRLQNGVDLDSVYDYSIGASHTAYDGVYNLQTLLFVLNSSRYWGNVEDDLTETEISNLMSDSDNCVMTLALTLEDENYKAYKYTIRFYAYSYHTLVSITNETTGEESHVFYIQTREVQKIAKIVVGITKGEQINPDDFN